MGSPLPNFLIIGALRSGTTSLALYLGAHPDVFMAPQKEIRYFDQHFDKGLEWYAQQFRGATIERAVGEASPGYMYHQEALARASRILPDAQLLAILREPVERAYSHYWLKHALGLETLSFHEAIARDPSYLDMGRYLPQLRRVCEHYPRERLFVTLFEELRDSPSETFLRACRFLQVADFLPPILGKAINPYTTFRSRSLRRFAKGLPSLAARVIGRLNTKRRMPYPDLNPSERDRLRESFQADNGALATWLGRDLSEWNRPSIRFDSQG